MKKVGEAYRANPALYNGLVVTVVSLIAAVLVDPRAAVAALLPLLQGVLTRAQVTPTIDGQSKVVTQAGEVLPTNAKF